MKASFVLLASVAMLAGGVANAEPSGNPFEGRLRQIDPERTMSAAEVTRHALPHLPRVSACYQRHAWPSARATGVLEIYLVISNVGRVVYSEIAAPGLAPRRLARLTGCVKREMTTWRFPARKGFTNAVLPYFFQRTRPADRPRVHTS